MKTIVLTDDEYRALRNMTEIIRYSTRPCYTQGYNHKFEYLFGDENKRLLDSVREKVWQANFK